MTGTAETELTEFNNIHDLAVQVVPTNRSVQREDSQDVVFRSESTSGRRGSGYAHAQEGAPRAHGHHLGGALGQIAQLLDEEGIGYELLNAKPENVERESEIVAQSGQGGSPRATNMAGREPTSCSAATPSSWHVCACASGSCPAW